MRSTAITGMVALFLSAALMAGCGALGGGGFNLVSIDEEWELGRELERELARELTLVNDPAALSYINDLGQRLVNQTAMSNLPWKFHIVADPAVNAFNIPGGHVYVYTGLIEEADNAAELAGVMAHEIAHGVERHATQQMSKAYGLNIAAAILLGSDPGLLQQLVAQVVGTGAIAKFSRDDEREADKLGVRYMYEVGYDPEGMATMFESLLRERERRPGAVAQFFATHPLSEERIENVRQEANRLPAKQGLAMNDNGFPTLKSRVAGVSGSR